MATVSQRVKQALVGCGKKQIELADHFGISRQAMSNKFSRDSWSADELAKVADFVGGELVIEMPDGQRIVVDPPKTEEGPNAV